jgi:hypothetical protein
MLAVAPILGKKQDAPVRVVFHLLFHERLFGETKRALLMEVEEVAPLQRNLSANERSPIISIISIQKYSLDP